MSQLSAAEPAQNPPKRRTRTPGGKRVTTAENLERERKALLLRQAGLTCQAIAEEVGYATPSAAWKAIQRALSRVHFEEATALRDIEGLRLDQMQRAIWGKVVKGDLKAIETALKIAKRRADLFGLDHSHGIAERAQRINETHAAAFANILTTTLDALDLTPAQQEHAKALIVTQLQALTGEPEAGAA